MGAALFNGSKLVSIGFNTYFKSHPEHLVHGRGQKKYFENIHAEQAALIKRKHYDGDDNLIMYVWRELDNGAPAHSKPCEMCQRLMKIGGVKKVRFLEPDGSWAEMKF
jgi:deoxycytidylate deaminase